MGRKLLIGIGAVVALFAVCIFVGISLSEQHQTAPQVPLDYHIFTAQEIAARSYFDEGSGYVQLNLEGDVNDHYKQIIEVVRLVRENLGKNTGRRARIVAWTPEARHASYGVGPYVYGIWFRYEFEDGRQ